LKRINIFFNFFTIGSHAILVFLFQTSWQYSLTGALMQVGYAKIVILDEYLAIGSMTGEV